MLGLEDLPLKRRGLNVIQTETLLIMVYICTWHDTKSKRTEIKHRSENWIIELLDESERALQSMNGKRDRKNSSFEAKNVLN